MSWDGYVTNLEQGKGHCKYGGIFGRQGGVWAQTAPDKAGITVSPDEVAKINQSVASQDQSIMGTGVTFGGTKFTCLRMEPELLLCQGKGDQKEHSLVVGLSNQAVIVGFNPSPEVKTAQVREGVEAIRDYLKTSGY